MVILPAMKTAISIPDDIYKKAERTAKQLGMSRSELYATAVREYIKTYNREHITGKLNEVYAEDDSSSELDPALTTMQAKSVKGDRW